MSKSVITDKIPTWHELTLIDDRKIGIKIHPRAWELVKSILSDTGKVKYLEDGFKGRFATPGNGELWGFNNDFSARELPDGWILVTAFLPIMKSKEMRDADFMTALRFRATLRSLFAALVVFQLQCKATDAATTQLMTISGVRAEEGPYGAAMCVEFSPEMPEWFATLGTPEDRKQLKAVGKAMFRSYLVMWPDLLRGIRHAHELFYVHLGAPDDFRMHVHGNATSLYAEVEDHYPPGSGYKLECTNLDGSLQQIALLAGLSKLHDLVRNSKKPT